MAEDPGIKRRCKALVGDQRRMALFLDNVPLLELLVIPDLPFLVHHTAHCNVVGYSLMPCRIVISMIIENIQCLCMDDFVKC